MATVKTPSILTQKLYIVNNAVNLDRENQCTIMRIIENADCLHHIRPVGDRLDIDLAVLKDSVIQQIYDVIRHRYAVLSRPVG